MQKNIQRRRQTESDEHNRQLEGGRRREHCFEVYEIEIEFDFITQKVVASERAT